MLMLLILENQIINGMSWTGATGIKAVKTSRRLGQMQRTILGFGSVGTLNIYLLKQPWTENNIQYMLSDVWCYNTSKPTRNIM